MVNNENNCLRFLDFYILLLLFYNITLSAVRDRGGSPGGVRGGHRANTNIVLATLRQACHHVNSRCYGDSYSCMS